MNLQQSTDKALIAAAQDGNREAECELVKRYRPLVLSLANRDHVRIVKDEAISYLWERFLVAVRKYDPSRNVPPAGWFKQALHYDLWNAFKRRRRRWQREVSGDGPDSPLAQVSVCPDPVANLIALELQEAVQREVRRLTPKQSEVIVAKYWQGLLFKEIAARFGVSAQAISDLHQRALRALYRALHRDYFGR